jgi:hypothetical protein
MEKVTLWNSMGAQFAAAVETATPPLVSLAQHQLLGHESAVAVEVQADVNGVALSTTVELLV